MKSSVWVKLLLVLLFLMLPFSSFGTVAGPCYLRFRVTWEFIPVGRIELWNTGRELVAYSRTTGLGALIFPFRSLWRTRLDPRGFPLKTRIEVVERGHPKLKIFTFEVGKGRVVREKLTPHKRVREIYRIPLPAYDELSAFWATLAHPWKAPGERLLLPVFARGRIHRVTLEARAFEEIRTFRGWERALRLEALMPFESELIRRSRRLKLYLSPKGLPLAGEGDIPLGHLKVYLERVLAGSRIPPPPGALLRKGWPASY
ncbi:DUF3108 domain-containing protein [Thermosulfurimonas sp. F29]|uniref:DUF3108 domain-containing protein n=1 Tax=Thermosulfurimonas sp. F29 TaxID=2867247 RepID=UPI001C82E2A0|nr:DUF3108 domain-containing protein [Thermosulfurimonas sp. F29]MBX6423305.1 DUF3108 domain-containing protein [Thermosulfurimonas sp. F29]